MIQTTFFIEKHNFHGFELLGKLSGGNVRVDIQNLPVVALCETA